MTLTAGSTLQSGKYVIQETLHQSDFSITYRAVHAYLNHAVLIQSFNECLREHHRFEQLRQLFIAEVRRRSGGQNDSGIKILDGFEEADMPFVVLEIVPQQPLPKLRDWLPLTQLITAEPTATPSLPPEPNIPERSDATPSPIAMELANTAPAAGVEAALNAVQHPEQTPVLSLLDGVIELEPDPQNGKTSPPQLAIDSGVNGKSALSGKPKTTVLVSGQKGKGKGKTAPPSSPQSGFQPQRLLPLALMVTAIVGGLGGASVGWVLRFGQTSDASPTESAGDTPLFNFGKEQSFPPLDDWPVTDTSDFSTTDEWEPSNAIAAPRRDRVQYNRVPEPAAVENPGYSASERASDRAPEPTVEAPPKEIEPTSPEFEPPAKQPPAVEPPTDVAPPAPPLPEPVAPAPAPDGASNAAPSSEREPVSTLDSSDNVQ